MTKLPAATSALITVAEDFEKTADRMERENVSSAQGIRRDWLRESARIIRENVASLSEREEQGYGVYVAVDTALVIDVLPDPDNAAKDLGVLNIANALPQSLAPAIGALLLGIGGLAGSNYTALFWGAGITVVLGALTIIPIKSVR